jgi:hypothetical protein
MLRPCSHCVLSFLSDIHGNQTKRVATHQADCPVTLLYNAACANQPEKVMTLIQKHKDLNCDAFFETEKDCLENALTVATKKNYLDVVEILIKAGSFVDVRTGFRGAGDLCTPRDLLDANSKTASLIDRCTPVARITYAKII